MTLTQSPSPSPALLADQTCCSPVYPETSGRSLESIDALFAANSIFNTKMERSYMAHGDVLAERGNHDNQVLSASDSGSKPGPPGSVEKLQV